MVRNSKTDPGDLALTKPLNWLTTVVCSRAIVGWCQLTTSLRVTNRKLGWCQFVTSVSAANETHAQPLSAANMVDLEAQHGEF